MKGQTTKVRTNVLEVLESAGEQSVAIISAEVGSPIGKLAFVGDGEDAYIALSSVSGRMADHFRIPAATFHADGLIRCRKTVSVHAEVSQDCMTARNLVTSRAMRVVEREQLSALGTAVSECFAMTNPLLGKAFDEWCNGKCLELLEKFAAIGRRVASGGPVIEPEPEPEKYLTSYQIAATLLPRDADLMCLRSVADMLYHCATVHRGEFANGEIQEIQTQKGKVLYRYNTKGVERALVKIQELLSYVSPCVSETLRTGVGLSARSESSLGRQVDRTIEQMKREG